MFVPEPCLRRDVHVASQSSLVQLYFELSFKIKSEARGLRAILISQPPDSYVRMELGGEYIHRVRVR